jgi:hypothetical protein
MQTDAKNDGAWEADGLSRLALLVSLGKRKHQPADRSGQRKHKLKSIRVVDEIGEVDLLEALNSGDPERSELVQWVDECLESGRDENGVERPARRRIRTDGPAAWRGWLKAKRALFLGLDGNGQPTLTLEFLSDRNGGITMMNPALFMGFFLSDLRTLVAKCKECGRYFLLRQTNRIKPYKEGTFCEEHQSARRKDLKARSAKQVRDDAKNTLFTLVATKFSAEIKADSKWFENTRLRDRIVGFLNQAIDDDDELRAIYRSGGRDGITIKWLGYMKNRAGITAATKSLKSKSRN